jgi:predicted phosphoribosyltransferase
MRAAVQAVRHLQPARVIVAVPVGAPESCQLLVQIADDVICLQMPIPFSAVGLWYEDFAPTSDEALVEQAASRVRTTAIVA